MTTKELTEAAPVWTEQKLAVLEAATEAAVYDYAVACAVDTAAARSLAKRQPWLPLQKSQMSEPHNGLPPQHVGGVGLGHQEAFGHLLTLARC